MLANQPVVLNSPLAVMLFRKLAYHAAVTIPYYQKKFAHIDFSQADLPLTDIPLLTKEAARDFQDELVVPEFLSDQSVKEVAHTSGSTGIPLRLIRRRSEMLHAAKFLWEARQALFPDIFQARGITISNRLYNTPATSDAAIRLRGKATMLVETTFDYKPEQAGQYLDELDYYQPRWLAGPPALLSLLAHYIRSQNRPLKTPLVFVETRGSLLNDETRTKLAETFNCPIVNHYGTEETQTIAYECPKGNMHIFDSCLLELWPREISGEYDLIITGLLFEIMPFIRYQLGDILCYQPVSCSCGNPHAVLGTIQGRINELIAGTALNGPYVFHLIMERVVTALGLNIVLQYQIDQIALQEFEVRVVLHDPSYIDHFSRAFQQAACGVLPLAHFTFIQVAHIDPSPGGKLQPFFRHI